MPRPVARENMSSRCFRFSRSSRFAGRSNRVSSANWRMGQARFVSIGCLTPPECLISCWRTSAIMRNRYGDSGSPCRSPRLQLNQGPGTPFTNTADLEVVRRSIIHEHQSSENPLACRIQTRLSQSTKSKALAKSNLRTRVGILRWWQH